MQKKIWVAKHHSSRFSKSFILSNKKRISNWHTKPYGCHFMSNNKWLSMYYYLVYRDEGLGCLWESSNPNVRIKYSVTLKTFVNAPEQGRCILGY